jgi:hypothetical protein
LKIGRKKQHPPGFCSLFGSRAAFSAPASALISHVTGTAACFRLTYAMAPASPNRSIAW